MANYPNDEPLPGSDRSLNDIGTDGVHVYQKRNGRTHVTAFNNDGSRFSWDVDKNGDYVPGTVHYTDEAAKLLGEDTIGPDATYKNRW